MSAVLREATSKDKKKAASSFSKITDVIEEFVIAFFLGVMTLITFANVVARYVFNTNILWALELTVFLFAWLVLLGTAYCVKKNLHLGVDVFVITLGPRLHKICALISVTLCLGYAALLLKGSWDYWYPFLSQRAWLETDDIPVPFFLRFLETLVNEGEPYEKLPRFIPYFVLPLSMLILLARFTQAARDILRDERPSVIAEHGPGAGKSEPLPTK